MKTFKFTAGEFVQARTLIRLSDPNWRKDLFYYVAFRDVGAGGKPFLIAYRAKRANALKPNEMHTRNQSVREHIFRATVPEDTKGYKGRTKNIFAIDFTRPDKFIQAAGESLVIKAVRLHRNNELALHDKANKIRVLTNPDSRWTPPSGYTDPPRLTMDYDRAADSAQEDILARQRAEREAHEAKQRALDEAAGIEPTTPVKKPRKKRKQSLPRSTTIESLEERGLLTQTATNFLADVTPTLGELEARHRENPDFISGIFGLASRGKFYNEVRAALDDLFAKIEVEPD